MALEFHRLGIGEPFPLRPSTATAPATCSTRSSRCCPGSGRPEVGEEAIRVAILGRPNVGKSSLLNALARRGAGDRLGRARNDPRRDRHCSAWRQDLRPRRHSGSAPKAQAAAGDRVLLRAARARGGGARRHRARPRRCSEGIVDQDCPWQTSPGRRVLDARGLSKWDIGRSGSRSPPPARGAAPPAPAVAPSPRRRAAGSSGSRPDRGALREAHRRDLDGELNRFLGELRERAQPPPAGAGSTSSTGAGRRRGRRASASSSTTRASSRATRLLGREPAARALRARGRAGRRSTSSASARDERERRRRRRAWGKASRALLADRGHEVTLACRDAEQARAIARTGRNPRYLPTSTCRGRGDDDRRGAAREAELVVVAVPSRAFGAVVAALPGDCAGAEPDEGPRPGDRRPPLDARPRAAGRRSLGPQHRRGDRSPACRPRR